MPLDDFQKRVIAILMPPRSPAAPLPGGPSCSATVSGCPRIRTGSIPTTQTSQLSPSGISRPSIQQASLSAPRPRTKASSRRPYPRRPRAAPPFSGCSRAAGISFNRCRTSCSAGACTWLISRSTRHSRPADAGRSGFTPISLCPPLHDPALAPLLVRSRQGRILIAAVASRKDRRHRRLPAGGLRCPCVEHGAAEGCRGPEDRAGRDRRGARYHRASSPRTCRLALR
jgi:hypothetical protein